MMLEASIIRIIDSYGISSVTPTRQLDLATRLARWSSYIYTDSWMLSDTILSQ